MKYANATTVSIERSRAEIEQIVRKYGASKFISSWDNSESVIIFVCHNRLVRFKMPMPKESEAEKTEKGQIRHLKSTRLSWLENEGKRRWRALVLTIKGKLESVSSGIETFEEAFLSHIVTDDKRTVYERILDNKSSIKMIAPTESVAS